MFESLVQTFSGLAGGIGSEKEYAAEGPQRSALPSVSATGMMRWKEWWWNDPEGLRHCDGPSGLNEIDDAEKLQVIKRTWHVAGDPELLAYLRQVRAHASTFEWEYESDGLTYCFCENYQADLQSVLEHLDRTLGRTLGAGVMQLSSTPLRRGSGGGAAAGKGQGRRASNPPSAARNRGAQQPKRNGATAAEAISPQKGTSTKTATPSAMKENIENTARTPGAAGGKKSAPGGDGSAAAPRSPPPRRPAARKSIESTAAAEVSAAKKSRFSPETWNQPNADEFPEVWLRGARADAVPNEELRAMFAEDQADRMPPRGQDIDWAVVGPRDDARRRRVLEILQDEEGCVAPLDFYHAAFMCHHASAAEVDFYRAANLLALEAVRLCPRNQQYRWLFAAAKDRLLRGLGKPQLFGIQKAVRSAKGGWWIPGGVEPWVTEEMRRQWAAPTLKEVERRRGRRLTENEVVSKA